MKYLLILVILFGIAGNCYAGDDEVKSRYVDITPNDGFMDAGTVFNPYVVEDSSGREVAEVSSRMLDLTPKDGFMDAGTVFNPYVAVQNGREIGTVQPRYKDLTPNDGFMDAGTVFNPYELE